LIAALVFALGIAAVFQLQGRLFQSSSSAQARAVAMVLAEETLEQQRHFLNADGFEAIQDLVEADAESITVGNITFDRWWDVTEYYYDPDDNRVCRFVDQKDADDEDCAAPLGTLPDQKEVVVNRGWVDTDGSSQDLQLQGLIGRGTPPGAAVALAGGAGGSGEAPIVPYIPSEDVQVTPIEVGDDTKRETLIPATSTVDGFTRTTFVAYTYRDIGAGEYVLDRQEDFITVACNCRFDGVSTEGNPTYASSACAME
jgi:hypothetical protein